MIKSNEATIEQMNEAIAIFMGLKIYDEGLTRCVVNDSGLGHPVADLRYHESWTWLMPVVEKIASISPDDVVHIEFGKTFTRCNLWNIDNARTHVFDESKETPIRTVHHAVYQFIQWYNSQNTTNE